MSVEFMSRLVGNLHQLCASVTVNERRAGAFLIRTEKLTFCRKIFSVRFSTALWKMVWHKIRKAKTQEKNFGPMRKPFEISFDFPVALSDLKVSLTATVEIHHSDLYFLVRDFHFKSPENRQEDHSVLPEQEIRRIKSNGSYAWVHKDSEKGSQLSQAIGAAIENALTNEELDVIETDK